MSFVNLLAAQISSDGSSRQQIKGKRRSFKAADRIFIEELQKDDEAPALRKSPFDQKRQASRLRYVPAKPWRAADDS